MIQLMMVMVVVVDEDNWRMVFGRVVEGDLRTVLDSWIIGKHLLQGQGRTRAYG